MSHEATPHDVNRINDFLKRLQALEDETGIHLADGCPLIINYRKGVLVQGYAWNKERNCYEHTGVFK